MKREDYFDPNTPMGQKRQKWVDALRSGKYRQGTTKLGDAEGGFCCLGLGCHVLGIDYDPEDGTNYEFCSAVGLISESGTLHDKAFYGQESLIDINDDTPAGFKRIGAWIERNPECVFLDVN